LPADLSAEAQRAKAEASAKAGCLKIAYTTRVIPGRAEGAGPE
jgi:hypothetical protein